MNDYANMIQQGFSTLGQGVASNQARLQQEADKNRQVHPAIEKYMKLMLAGQMPPEHAAIAAKLEMHGQTPPDQQGQGQGQFSPAQSMPGQEGQLSPEAISLASMAPSQNPAGFAQNRVQQTQSAQAPQPQTLGDLASSQPFTAQDLSDADKVMQYTKRGQSGLTYDQQVQLENLKFGNREKIVDKSETGKNTRQSASQGLSREQMDQKVDLAREEMRARRADLLARLRALSEQTRNKYGNSVTPTVISAAKDQVKGIRQQIKAYESGPMKDELIDETAKLKDELETANDYLDELMKAATQHGFQQSTRDTIRTSTPQGFASPPQTQTQPSGGQDRARQAAGLFSGNYGQP